MTHESVKKAAGKIRDELNKLSARERMLLIAAVVAILVAVIAKGVKAVTGAFAEQKRAMTAIEQDRADVVDTLKKYKVLKLRKDEIQKRYREVEIKEGVRSLLENLLRSKAEVTQGYSIKDLDPIKIGSQYELAPFAVRFSIQSNPALVTFLKEAVQGEKPLILTDLEIKRSRSSDKLDVALGVGTIRESKQ